MGRSRGERRAVRGALVDVFSANHALGWVVVRQVPAAYALQQVALQKWREIWLDNGELAGVQPLKPEERRALGDILVQRLLAVTITLPELRRNAGLYGRSHTAGLPEWRRVKRHARFDESRILPPEDATERAIEKVGAWPYPANADGDKAVRVYPAPVAGAYSVIADRSLRIARG